MSEFAMTCSVNLITQSNFKHIWFQYSFSRIECKLKLFFAVIFQLHVRLRDVLAACFLGATLLVILPFNDVDKCTYTMVASFEVYC